MRKLTILAAPVLALLSSVVLASPIAQIVRVTDSSGNPVSGATFSISGTTLTAGTAATVSGLNIDTGAALSSPSVKYYDFGDGSGQYSFIYDPAAAEGHFTVTASKSGVTLSNAVFGLNFFADPSIVASTNAISTANGTKLDTVNATTTSTNTLVGGIKPQTDLIGTNAADSPAAKTAQTGTTANGTGISTLVARPAQTGDSYALATTGAGVKIASGQSTTASNFVAGPTALQIRQEMDANSTRFSALAVNLSQPILFDGSGNVKSAAQAPVTLASVQNFNNTGQTTAPAWLGNTSVLLTAEQSKLLTASTAQQSGQAVTLPAAPTGYGGATLAQIQQLLPANFGLFSVDSTGGVKVVSLPAAPTGYGFSGLQTTDINAVRDAIFNFPVFADSPALTFRLATGDTWAASAGPSTATAPDPTHQNTVFTTPAGGAQHSSAITASSTGRPLSRTITRP